jgi:DNA-binding response OmpR family regulator
MGNLKVLIVEDDQDLLEIEKEQLEGIGYQVVAHQQVSSARDEILKQKFDCILLDMNLKGQSGKDLIYAARTTNSPNTMTPIVIISGDLNLELVREVRDKIAAIIVKPFSPTELKEKISEAIIKNKSIRNAKKNPTNTIQQKIFIVDDDQEYTEDLKKFFEEENFVVVVSNNTQEASVKLQNQKFDLMITDFNIDQRTGEWLVNVLRKDSSHINHKIPIIVVTGFFNNLSPKLNTLIQDAHEKPVTFLTLLQSVRKELPKPIKAPVKLI